MKQQKHTPKIISCKNRIPTSNGGIKREFLKTKNTWRVFFKLPAKSAVPAKQVYLVGDFNNWDTSAHPMKKLKNGDFTISLELEPEKQYQFRYLLDIGRWENDCQADGYARSDYGDCDNSVICLSQV